MTADAAGGAVAFVVDNAVNDTPAGSLSIHPPLLPDQGRAALNFSCGDKPSSQLTFKYRGYRASADQGLRLLIDGKIHETYGNTPDGAWLTITIAPAGDTPTSTKLHTYRWEVTTDRAGQPPYWIDAITCADVAPQPNPSGVWGFAEGHYPVELTADADGGAAAFVVDNDANDTPAGSLSIRPPLLPDDGKAALNFSCGDAPSSALGFRYRGYGPSAGQLLNLYVDGKLHGTYRGTPEGAWVDVTIAPASDPPTSRQRHLYRWEAVTDRASRPPYWIDAVRCRDVAPQANASGVWAFDEGHYPIELTAGPEGDATAFLVDNGASYGPGDSLSIHPPPLPDNGRATLSFSCGDRPSSQLTFMLRGFNPTAGQTLTLYVDGKLYRTLGGTPDGAWVNVTLDPAGDTPTSTRTHVYRWEAVTDRAGQPPYWIDALACEDHPPRPNTGGTWSFGEGHYPVELTADPDGVAAAFVVDNEANDTPAGPLAIHPPLLPSRGRAALNFSCGGKPHRRLTFDYRGYLPAPEQVLHVYVDGALHASYGGTTDGSWVGVTIQHATTAVHAYRWETPTAAAGQPPYFLDDLRCE